MSNKTVVKSELVIQADAARIWEFLSDPARFARLFSPTATAAFTGDGGDTRQGSMTLSGIAFTLRMAPYDLLLSAAGCTIVLRLTPRADDRCLAEMAASSLAESGLLIRELDLYNVLSRLRSVTAEQGAAPLPAAAAPAAVQEPAPARHTGRVVAVLLAAALLVGGGALLLPRLISPGSGHTNADTAQRDGARSELVTLQNARTLAPGMDRQAVERLFGEPGTQLDDGRSVLYCGAAVNTAGQPIEQVKVVYDGSDTIQSLTYLNLEACTAIGAVSNLFPAITDPDLDAIITQVGAPLSMLRRSADGMEAHFGYLDPFANFDPAWRGELSVCVASDGAVTVDRRTGYDGGDPLMVESLENTPLAAQYDSYTVFLQDKYQYDKALLMRGKYTLGDVAAIFGEPVAYDAGSGAMIYSVQSPETLEDGVTPLYQYSFGFGSAGQFSMSSFVNMRLFRRAGMLDATRSQAVTRNMSYGEVRSLVGILPTALYLNDNFLLLGYGQYTGGTEPELQFELVVKLRLDTMYVDSVYSNAAAG